MHPREFMPEALPWSHEAEASVLGALMLDSTAWDSVADILTAEQFFDARNGRIFTAVAGLVAASRPADIVTVFDQLQASGSGEVHIPFHRDRTFRQRDQGFRSS